MNSNNDSCTCIPNYQLRAAVKKIEEGKIMKMEFDATKQSLRLLELRILVKDSLIKLKDSLFSFEQQKVEILNAKVSNLQDQKRLLNESVQKYKGELKKVKTKLWLVGGVSVAVCTSIILLVK